MTTLRRFAAPAHPPKRPLRAARAPITDGTETAAVVFRFEKRHASSSCRRAARARFLYENYIEI